MQIVNVQGRSVVNTKARTTQFKHAILKGFVGLALFSATAAILNNVLSYRLILQQRQQQAEDVAVSLATPGKHDESTNEMLRHNFYALLEALGNDPSLHHGDTGVFVTDPAFFDGAYIEKSPDAVLDRCAVQPFTIPAMTGMPLVAGLRARQNACKYDSYAYQYLPGRKSIDPAVLSQPCALTRLRGLRKVVVIDRKDMTFTTTRLDCEKH
ncbi:hypothetical protein [Paraburkholderia graminis]|uniref:hypothetical protein n=1 Tax=Paraburkholderia graminis TaxID=60548 RepID=UPI0038BD239E